MSLPTKCRKCGDFNEWFATKLADIWIAHVSCKNEKCKHRESEPLAKLSVKYD